VETGRYTALGVGTLYAILRGAHLVIRQCRSWFGRFGQRKQLDKAEFARRKADVTAQSGALPPGEITVCVDSKRGYHRPEPGACWQHREVPAQRPARYHKSGTRTDILGALAPREARLTLAAVPAATGVSVAAFLARMVSDCVAAGWQLVHLILDNASVHTAALKEPCLAAWLPHLQVHWTPPHASWLNLAEPFWSGFDRAVLRTSDLRSYAEVEAVTVAYAAYWQAHPQEYHWPKQPRRRRKRRQPFWRQLELIPINS
jgi:hypothetical protein